MRTRNPTLSDVLAGWVGAGLITPEQSDAIVAHERAASESRAAPRPPHRRVPGVAEALGYLGGTLALGGLVLLAARYWSDLPTAGRLLATGTAAAVLLGAGALVSGTADPALARLRQIVWLAATAATAVGSVVLVRDALGVERAATTVLVTSAAVAVESGLLWWGRRPVQLFVFLAGGIAGLGAAVAHVTAMGPVGLTVLAAGGVVLFVGLRHLLPTPIVVETAGALGGLVGTVLVTNAWEGAGFLLLVGYGLALTALALSPGPAWPRGDRLVLGIVGGITLLQGIPPTLGHFVPGAAAATGIVVLVLGSALLYLGASGRVRLAGAVEAGGAVVMLGGPALTWTQWHGVAPVLGAVVAVGLVALGLLPDRLVLSLLGSVGLLVYVPWTIGWYFPGQGRVPILTVAAGAIIIVAAVMLTRTGGRPGHRLGMHRS